MRVPNAVSVYSTVPGRGHTHSPPPRQPNALGSARVAHVSPAPPQRAANNTMLAGPLGAATTMLTQPMGNSSLMRVPLAKTAQSVAVVESQAFQEPAIAPSSSIVPVIIRSGLVRRSAFAQQRVSKLTQDMRAVERTIGGLEAENASLKARILFEKTSLFEQFFGRNDISLLHCCLHIWHRTAADASKTREFDRVQALRVTDQQAYEARIAELEAAIKDQRENFEAQINEVLDRAAVEQEEAQLLEERIDHSEAILGSIAELTAAYPHDPNRQSSSLGMDSLMRGLQQALSDLDVSCNFRDRADAGVAAQTRVMPTLATSISGQTTSDRSSVATLPNGGQGIAQSILAQVGFQQTARPSPVQQPVRVPPGPGNVQTKAVVFV